MGYVLFENKKAMDASFDEIPDRNKDMENTAMGVKDYRGDFRPAASGMRMPVLFFYGRTDWMIGPDHYKGVHFPNMMLWGSDVGHVPFLENKVDMEKAIASFMKKYNF